MIGEGVGDAEAEEDAEETEEEEETDEDVDETVRVTLKVVGRTVVMRVFWLFVRVDRVEVTLAVVRESDKEGDGDGDGDENDEETGEDDEDDEEEGRWATTRARKTGTTARRRMTGESQTQGFLVVLCTANYLRVADQTTSFMSSNSVSNLSQSAQKRLASRLYSQGSSASSIPDSLHRCLLLPPPRPPLSPPH